MALILIAVAAMIFQGCKKDDDSSSGNYFAIDGTRHELAKCYVTKLINSVAGHESDDNYNVFFTSSNVAITSDSVNTDITGIGDLFGLSLSTNKNVAGIDNGDYVYNPDVSVSSTYSECAFIIGMNTVADTVGSYGTTDLASKVKVAKSGNAYQFSYDGKTSTGKALVFRYNGTMATIPPTVVKK